MVWAWTWLLARFQHAAAALWRAAAAGKYLIDIGGIVVIALYGIIVRQLFTRSNGADRFDKNSLVRIDGLAIRIAAVIDEARLVAVDAGIDHRFLVHGEQKGMAIERILIGVALVGLVMAHAVAEILDDGGALADAP